MQKRILALHDLAGLGRSSLAPIIAVLSAMGHQCVPLPTAVYSSHLALPGWHGCDLTEHLRPALAQYTALKQRFDALFAGFLSSAEQIDIVAEAAHRCDMTIIDPVLGDNGRLYSSVTPALCEKMKWLCERANVITPNASEAAVLLGRDPIETPRGEAEAHEWAYALWKRFGASVVLTGLPLQKDKLTIVCYENGTPQVLEHPHIEAYYPGTGDIFAAVLTGGLVSGDKLGVSAWRAALFVHACIAATESEGTDRMLGVQFERQLGQLWNGE